MNNKYFFHLIKVRSSVYRNEQINIGLIATPFDKNITSKVNVYNYANKDKLIPLGLRVDDVKSMLMEFEMLVGLLGISEAIQQMAHSRLILEESGYFIARTQQAYNDNIDNILKKLVFLKNEQRRPQKRKIISEVKSFFKNYDLISNHISDLDNHKLVSNFPISEEKGLVTDLMLKNGLYSLVETLDINPSQPNSASEKISLKVLTLNEAKALYGDTNVDSFFVYSLDYSEERKLRPQMNLAHSFTRNMVNLHDNQAKQNFIQKILLKAGTNPRDDQFL